MIRVVSERERELAGRSVDEKEREVRVEATQIVQQKKFQSSIWLKVGVPKRGGKE